MSTARWRAMPPRGRDDPVMSMRCPTCRSEHDIGRERIGPVGQKVRCGACGDSWFVPAPTSPGHAAPERRSGPILDAIAVAPASRSRRQPARRETASRWHADGRASEARSWFARAGLAAAAATAAAVALVALPSAIAGRGAVARIFPGTMSLYAAIGLPASPSAMRLEGVASRLAREGDAVVLLASGEIANEAGTDRPAPAVAIEVQSPTGERLYGWRIAATDSIVPAHGRTAFTARLASPPGDGRTVRISLVDGSGTKPQPARVASR